jgi:sortase A
MNPVSDNEIFAQRGQRFIRWTRRVLVLCGALALAYVGFTLIDAGIYEKAAELKLQKQIQTQETHPAQSPKLLKEGDILGQIRIPRIGVSVVVLEGTTSQTLQHGVGHIGGTALPGEPGNIGIAGHRDTYFRGLKDLRAHDEIQMQTVAGLATYEVDWIQITVPSDVAIVSHTTESALTLVTCYPFHFIGAAPERFVVHARRQ